MRRATPNLTAPCRIGLAHPLAEGALIEPIRALTEKYPKVRLRLLSELTGELFNRLLAGELDVAAVLLPEGRIAPPPLLTNTIATDRWEIVQGDAGNIGADWKSLGKAPWVLNPPGCKARANLIDQMDRAGFTPMIAAEIHNMQSHRRAAKSRSRRYPANAAAATPIAGSSKAPPEASAFLTSKCCASLA